MVMMTMRMTTRTPRAAGVAGSCSVRVRHVHAHLVEPAVCVAGSDSGARSTAVAAATPTAPTTAALVDATGGAAMAVASCAVASR
jgi:hypothetical protein